MRDLNHFPTASPGFGLGLSLGNVGSDDPNVLDWYEEGVWTPAISAATPGTLTVTYYAQTGRFIRIGRHIQVWFYISVNAFSIGTATGALYVTGLPYRCGLPISAYGNFSSAGYDWGGTIPVLSLSPGDNKIGINGITDTSTAASSLIGGLHAGDSLSGAIAYLAP